MKYVSPEVELMVLAAADVITTSGTTNEEGEVTPPGVDW